MPRALLCCSAFQSDRGIPLPGVLLCRSVGHALDGPPSLLFWCLGKERLWLWLHPFHVTQQYHFASMAAQLSSTGTSHHNLFPYSPSIRLSDVNSSPRPGIDHNPYSPAPSHCTFQGTCIPAQCMNGCGKDCLILFQLGCHRSAVSLSALNVPPLTQTIALMWRADPCFSSPTC